MGNDSAPFIWQKIIQYVGNCEGCESALKCTLHSAREKGAACNSGVGLSVHLFSKVLVFINVKLKNFIVDQTKISINCPFLPKLSSTPTPTREVHEAAQVCKVWVDMDCRVASALDCLSVCVSKVIYECVTIADSVKGQQVCQVRVTTVISLALVDYYQVKGLGQNF